MYILVGYLLKGHHPSDRFCTFLSASVTISSSASARAFMHSIQNPTKCCLVSGCPTLFSGEVSSRWHWLKHEAFTGPLCWETGAIWNSHQATRARRTRPYTYHHYLGHWGYNNTPPRYISQSTGEEKQVHVHIHMHTQHQTLLHYTNIFQNIRACHYRNESRSRNGWMSFPEAVKMNIAFSITVTAISSNDNCTMLLISLDLYFFPSQW